ncbi:MAG TPA: winged helix-turn-helix domain-containing protein [Sphingobium sp.]|nr:winged helix-turn-helix domain-containing protein [Sphingobium sp.]
MIYRFEDFELDPARFELRRAGVPVPTEPQVLALLLLLASNPDRLVSKDEIIEKIWNNRIVSEAAIAARIKSARKALRDDGQRQRLVRTVHGRGFRFMGAVQFVGAAPQADGPASTPDLEPPDLQSPGHRDRPSIAVLPFDVSGEAGALAFMADALADELIADLARLRWLFVIARGSSFRFRGQMPDCRQVGQALGVRYCLTGRLLFAGDAVTCAIELVDTADGGIVWAETYEDAVERVHALRHAIAAQVLAALEIRIPLNEALHARTRRPEQLDAWSAFHLGLDHMFRFNQADNRQAASLFDTALRQDSQFARACAGLSFTHFQNAFLGYAPDRAAEAEAARDLAERALQLDRLDPFCHLNMGRSLWLDGNLAESIDWLDQAMLISPNYAQGVYSKAWAETLAGDANAGESHARLALRLSPLDPLRYAMLATGALSQIIQGRYEEAAPLSERAARSPGAHKHIAVIAAVATSMAGQADRSLHWIDVARRRDPDLNAGQFLKSFPFALTGARERIERSLADLGL